MSLLGKFAKITARENIDLYSILFIYLFGDITQHLSMPIDYDKLKSWDKKHKRVRITCVMKAKQNMLQCLAHYVTLCDMIKRNESDVGRIVFEILAKTVFKFLCFILFLHCQILHNPVTRYPIVMGISSK